MPSFFAWLFRPAFKDNKVISSFSTFLRLLLSFFDIPRIISRFSESLGALRIASLVSASLLFFLSVFSLSIFFYSISSSLSHLSISISSISISSPSSSLVLYCVLFFIFIFSFSFSSLSHLTFPASFRYSLRLFSLFSFSIQSLLVLSASLRWSPIILGYIPNNVATAFPDFCCPRLCSLSVKSRLLPDKLLIFSYLSVEPYLLPDKMFV